MAKKLEKRLKLFMVLPSANAMHLKDLETNGRKVTRTTFKGYADPQDLQKIEEKLGYSNQHGGELAKDNLMIEYWRYKAAGTGDVVIYRPTKTTLYVFANK